jgi:tetratricopeptide (TPR) repeat protein
MPESTATELLSTLDGHLRAERGIDLSLTEATHSLAGLSPGSGLQEARKLLLRRVSDLQSSVSDLSSVIQKLRELQRVLRFTEAGWPERQRELAEACDADPLQGLAKWLDDWFTALASMRLDACQRLLAMDKALPAGADVLLRRCRTTALALDSGGMQDEHSLSLAAPLIHAGARGLHVGTETVPTPETRQQLSVLLVRLLLALDRPEDARRALKEAPEPADAPIFQALRERLRLYEQPSTPETTLVSSASPADALFEAARVLIGPGQAVVSDLQINAGMSAARKAVAAPGALEEARRQIDMMLAPVPAQIYLALAERAMTDGDDLVAREALERAIEVGAAGAVRAEAQERLADVAHRGGDDDGSIRHRLQAADIWADLSKYDRILSNAEQVLAVRPEHGEARCWKASSLMQLFWSPSVPGPWGNDNVGSQHHDSQRQLHKALNLAHTVAADEAGDTGNWLRAWALALESCLANRLAEFDDEPTRLHQWTALRAALLALTLQPRAEGYWLRLADAASDLELWSLAELAARRAAESLSAEAVEQHIRTLINLGEHDRALELLGDPLNVRQWNMRGHLLLHRGDSKGAAVVFAEHPPAPDEVWARLSHIVAMLLTGQRTEGLSAARDLDAWLRPRLKEFSKWDAVAWISMLLGDDARVEDMVERERSNGHNTSDLCLAVVRASQHREDEAAALLTSYVRSLTSLDDVLQWERVGVEVVKETLKHRKVAMPGLTGAQAVLRDVHAELADRRDPLVELRITAEKAKGFADPADTLLAPVIVAVARHDLEGAEKILRELTPTQDGESFAPLWLWLEEERELADVDMASAEMDVASAAAETDEMQGEAPTDDGAWPTPGEEPLEPEIERMRVYLPPSFFGVENPPADHPLFVRHLREMRLQPHGYLVPWVRVTDAEELEPDGYVIAMHDQTLEAGVLPLGRRVLSAAALALVPEEEDVTELEGQPGLGQSAQVTIPDTEKTELTLGGLLSRSAPEVLVARLEQLTPPANPAP